MQPSTHEVSAADGEPLLVRTWLPEGAPRALVVVVHGLGEHGGRYQRLADDLIAQGFAVVAGDHRGHGRSGGLRGHVDPFDQYVDDLAVVVEDARGRVGRELPWVFFAHSMGGLVGLRWLESDRPQPAAAALSNPLLQVAVEAPKIKLLAGRVLSRYLPRLRLANEIDPKWICRDPEVVRAYTADPLVHGKISTRWFTNMEAALVDTNGRAGSIRVPTVFVISGQDKLVHPDGSRRFHPQVAGARVLELPEAYHEAHNGPERDRVVAAATALYDEVLAG